MARKWQEREGTVEAGLNTMTQEAIVEDFLRCALPTHECDANQSREIPMLADSQTHRGRACSECTIRQCRAAA